MMETDITANSSADQPANKTDEDDSIVDDNLDVTSDETIKEQAEDVKQGSAAAAAAGTAAAASTVAPAQDEQNIVQLAMSQENLSTLVQAVQAADLVGTLEGDGPFTVFAPTNEAFEALPAGTLEDLLKPENKQKLATVLTYHVVPSEAMSSSLSDGQAIASVQGEDVNVKMKDGNVMIEGAKVTTPDVKASNGVVHIIDTVILPPSMTGTAQGAEQEGQN
jgi:uncharacterized surface protein with fasciclin (FAS1) repeats